MSRSESLAIGLRLRELRKQAGMSLRKVCDEADVAPSYLSNLERGGSSPTLAKLREILVALGTDLETFFSEVGGSAEQEEHMFKRERMRTVSDRSRRYTFLLPRHKEIEAEMLDEYLLPGEPRPELEVLESSVAGIVLAGVLELEVEGNAKELVRPGDAFHVPAGTPHRGRCISTEPVRLIAVFVPPKY